MLSYSCFQGLFSLEQDTLKLRRRSSNASIGHPRICGLVYDCSQIGANDKRKSRDFEASRQSEQMQYNQEQQQRQPKAHGLDKTPSGSSRDRYPLVSRVLKDDLENNRVEF